MKTIILGILLLGSVGFAATNSILLRSTTHVEYSPTPGTSTLTIDTDGNVDYQSPNVRRDGDSSGRPLAKLSPDALQRLKAQVAALNPDTALVDRNPEDPECADAPSVNMMAYQENAKEIRFYAESGCHEFRLEDWSGYGLIELIKGLEHLAFQ